MGMGREKAKKLVNGLGKEGLLSFNRCTGVSCRDYPCIWRNGDRFLGATSDWTILVKGASALRIFYDKNSGAKTDRTVCRLGKNARGHNQLKKASAQSKKCTSFRRQSSSMCRIN